MSLSNTDSFGTKKQWWNSRLLLKNADVMQCRLKEELQPLITRLAGDVDVLLLVQAFVGRLFLLFGM